MNGEYLRSLTDEQLADGLIAYDQQLASQKTLIMKIMPLIRDRMKVYGEFSTLAGFFINAPSVFEQAVSKENAQSLQQCLVNVEWNHDAMEHAIRLLAETKGRKAKDVFMELRVRVTGKTVGPPLLESLEILGKEETLTRLNTP
jgi:glutamyl-tRNA synthetase